MDTANPVPAGYHTLTPSVTIGDCQRAIALYEEALGAESGSPALHPDGRVLHAELQIGTSRIMVADAFPEMGGGGSVQDRGGSPVSFWLYVDDCDAAFQRAVAAGFTAASEPETMFWGDRTAVAVDPFGLRWTFATHVEDVSAEEMEARQKKMFGG